MSSATGKYAAVPELLNQNEEQFKKNWNELGTSLVPLQEHT